MGKKGVMLDNGKNAQSSMALYWKKHHEQAKKPKKQYEPTQQQQMDQRVESGFQKWKLHKEKMISKTYQKVQKQSKIEKNEANNCNEEIQEQQLFQKKEKKGPVHIPGFKSKQALEKKLRIQNKKEVNQSDNVLKLPLHMANVTQDDILNILRQKKAQSQMMKRKKNMQQKSDIMLADNFLEAFKPNLKEADDQVKKPQVEEEVVQEEKQFFKSSILNQLSKGNYSVLHPKEPEIQQKVKQQQAPKKDLEKQPQAELKQQTQHHIKPIFKPRVLANKK